MEQDLAEFCKKLPKVELHAHLNGSLSNQTLKVLHEMNCKSLAADADSWMQWETNIGHHKERSLEQCFQLFGIAHKLTSSPSALFKATEDVIHEFSQDGVVYLELRSTPREITGVMSKSEYIKAVAEAIQKSRNEGILVKLIVSLDRRQGRKVAEETLDLVSAANNHYPDIIVGVDLSGDPYQGVIDDYLPVLEKARSLGFKLAVHCAEIPGEEEAMKILKFKPDRLGHGTCLHPHSGGSAELWKEFLDSHIPIEICLTSNVSCKTVQCYADHHLEHVLSTKHPLTIATDDKGVFNTSLSNELNIAAKNFSLSKQDLFSLSMASLSYAFCSEQEKMELRDFFAQWEETHMGV